MTADPYQSRLREGPYGFADLVHAEWTKFRTVRGWVIAVAVAALAIVAFALAPGQQGSCNTVGCTVPTGPGGEEVSDGFYFVHQPLTGNGSIAVRVTSLTGQIPDLAGAGMRTGLVPWAKTGIIIKAGSTPGSAYAAMMVTGSHGVRMQYDFTHDEPGRAGAVSAASPRWLRLTRSGDTITGYDSVDGTHWAKVGTATLAGLPPAAQVGLFTTSPQYLQTSLGEASVSGGPSVATGVFDHVSLTWPSGSWVGDNLGGGGGPGSTVGFSQAAGAFTITGSGDIAPVVSGGGGVGVTVAQTLAGTFAGLIVLAVVGAVFMTAEYRRRLIFFTLAAAGRRGRVLAAKAVVVGAVTFAAGLAGAAIAVVVGQRVLRGNGAYVYPASALTQVRVIAGTAAVLAVAAVLALAIGTILRRGAGAVAVAVTVIVLPYLFTVAAPILPAGPAGWLLRVTPAAAFAVQQTLVQYPQVNNTYTAAYGYYPLPPWAGLAVLCAWAALALGLAAFLLRRRDA
ncbi:MAG: ABC transporter permease subunit [Streptosporangiaceae bacterium]|jgi:ABC-type transport system involved in multi-copper enzyme maturation permease subunit/regulation of enolase protein 1 (concanavalin A-like superfamily)